MQIYKEAKQDHQAFTEDLTKISEMMSTFLPVANPDDSEDTDR